MHDLSKLKITTETVTVELLHPVTEEPLMNPDGTPMSVTVYGSYSSVYQKIQDELSDERIAKSFSIGKSKEVVKTLPKTSEIREQSVDALAKSTIEWNLTMNKKPIEFSLEAARQLYTDFPFIRAQVEEKATDFEAFLGN